MTHSATARQNIKALAVAYGKAMGMTLGAVSRKFYGRTTFLENFLKGECSPSLDTADALIKRMIAEWPAETPMPKIKHTVHVESSK